MTTLVLASGSRYRAAQLATLGVPFESDAPDIDESALPGETPDALAVRLAAEKARAVLERHPHALVLGGDQVATLCGTRLGKPGDAASARAQLARQSGRCVEFLGAVHLIDGRDGRERSALVSTRATLRVLADEEIFRYVERDAPLDCAGAFKVESLGIALFERIESSDPSALVGLPLIATARLLRECGLAVP